MTWRGWWSSHPTTTATAVRRRPWHSHSWPIHHPHVVLLVHVWWHHVRWHHVWWHAPRTAHAWMHLNEGGGRRKTMGEHTREKADGTERVVSRQELWCCESVDGRLGVPSACKPRTDHETD